MLYVFSQTFSSSSSSSSAHNYEQDHLYCSEYSMQLNASRIKVLQAQDDVVNAMKDSAAKELLNVSHHHQSLHNHYKHLIRDLIVQVSGAKLIPRSTLY